FLGATSASTDGSGNGLFTFAASRLLSNNQWVTATATDPAGNTSEFSRARSAGTPAVFINGQFYPDNRTTVSASALVTLQTTFPGATILYTLDGSDPHLFPQVYTAPLMATASATIRAVAYDVAGRVSAESEPFVLTVQAPPRILLSPFGQTLAVGSSVLLS